MAMAKRYPTLLFDTLIFLLALCRPHRPEDLQRRHGLCQCAPATVYRYSSPPTRTSPSRTFGRTTIHIAGGGEHRRHPAPPGCAAASHRAAGGDVPSTRSSSPSSAREPIRRSMMSRSNAPSLRKRRDAALHPGVPHPQAAALPPPGVGEPAAAHPRHHRLNPTSPSSS